RDVRDGLAPVRAAGGGGRLLAEPKAVRRQLRIAVHHSLPTGPPTTPQRDSDAVPDAQAVHATSHLVHVIVGLTVAFLLALAGAALSAVRMIRGSSIDAGANAELDPTEDPRRARLALRKRPAAHRPRGGLRRAGRRLRPVPPLARQRRPHGE